METADVASLTPRPLFPLPEPAAGHDLFSPRRLRQWTFGFLLLGVLARCVRYFLRFPLWEDECFLCANFIDRDYRGMLDPLHYHQVAPILFLWLELTVVKLFGYTEMTLRLIPFLAGIASLALFYRLACVCLTGVPRLLAVALFSVTYGTIRYSAEAKPYGIDLFVSLVLVNFFINWLRAPGAEKGSDPLNAKGSDPFSAPQSNRWLWVMTACVPVALSLSYGAVMLGGGLSVTMAWVIWRERRWHSVKPWLAYSFVLVGSFLALYFLCIRVQATHELDKMRDFWEEHFPPLTGIGDFLWWIVYVHTGDILAYPGGGTPFQSSLATICWVAGLVALTRRRLGTMLVLCLAPQAVTFVAAVLKRYPYGGHIRLNLYLAPFMCMVIGYGAAALVAGLARRGRNATAVAHVFLAVLGLVGTVCIVRDLAGPYKNVSDQRARGFAQWFWFNESQQNEVACLTSDLGIILSPDQFSELNFSAQYLCNQRIYSPRHIKHKPVAWENVSARRPLVCVFFRSAQMPFDETKYHAWLRDMLAKYDLVGRDSLPILRSTKSGLVCDFDSIETFRFVPKGPATVAADTASDKQGGLWDTHEVAHAEPGR